MLDGILRRQHHERLRQFVGVVVHGDLRFVHGFEQRRLRLRRRAVDFVRQDDVGENRAGLEIESLFDLIEYAGADHVRGQQVRSKLDALERAMEGIRDGLRQGGLAHAGNIFNQQVAFGQQGHERQTDDFVLAANHAGYRRLQLRDLICRGCGHWLKIPVASVTNEASVHGRLAQWLERSLHTREVQGSSP